MTQEEKAKAYDEALERAKKLHEDCDGKPVLGWYEYIFPELAESEDEKIRKWLIGLLSELQYHLCGDEREMGNKALAWVEKQCEQKPFDYENANIQQKDFAPKVEPKFKVGDWITDGEAVSHITSYSIDYGYQLETPKGTLFLSNDNVENKYHLWSIQDAKDGDVLAAYDWVFLFKKLNTNGKPVCYCHYDIELGFAIDANTYISTGSYIRPAAKEERDLLFQKMKEAGYEWDADKKELKKSQRMISAEAKEALCGKPAWSKNDEETLESLCSLLQDYGSPFEGAVIDWLKSLKQRIGG